tara:strand:- start:249 stop:1016 length:768 start_codon:yes stop_codon:yes gene_type:complete
MSVKIDLTGKNILITGAGGSIGIEIVSKFLEAGANCICLDKNLKDLKKIKSKKSFLNRVTLININFEKKNYLTSIIYKLKKIKKINVLINNAGFTSSKNFLKYKLADWEKTININLTTPFLISQIISKNFMRSGGSIINITSLAAEQGFPNNVAYVASKGGLKQLTKAMAIDLSSKNIRVNSVGPGYVRTKMTEKSWLDKKKKLNRSERIILDRWGNPRDIADACLFLGSDLANYINGQEIYVDGGWLSKGLKND